MPKDRQLAQSARHRRHARRGRAIPGIEVRLVVMLQHHTLHPFVRQGLQLHDDLVRRADQPALLPECIWHGTRVE